jgi:hypothetical protein
MNKEYFLARVEEIIKGSDLEDIKEDGDSGCVTIEFSGHTMLGTLDEDIQCEIGFMYKIFGLISFISLKSSRTDGEVLNFRITRSEYKKLKSLIKGKKDVVKQKEIDYLFKDHSRDVKIKDILSK